ncbi:hypothetical protein MYX82_04410 [Acidobacteria bacterium AH-259-D05]|nr:hypothetical protein [Acidobacteria bacterium AH-259-D05]
MQRYIRLAGIEIEEATEGLRILPDAPVMAKAVYLFGKEGDDLWAILPKNHPQGTLPSWSRHYTLLSQICTRFARLIWLRR